MFSFKNYCEEPSFDGKKELDNFGKRQTALKKGGGGNLGIGSEKLRRTGEKNRVGPSGRETSGGG